MTQRSLYPELLGEAWASLPRPVRELHGGPAPGGAGRLRVERARGWLGSCLGALFALPAPGEHEVTVEIEQGPTGNEVWQRRFGDAPLVTYQRREGARLVERLGRVELAFELTASGDALVFEQRGQWLAVGPLRVPLPRWISPRIRAHARGRAHAVFVHVQLVVPGVGVLLSYEGIIVVRPAAVPRLEDRS